MKSKNHPTLRKNYAHGTIKAAIRVLTIVPALAWASCSSEDFDYETIGGADNSVKFTTYIGESRGTATTSSNLSSFAVFASYDKGHIYANGIKKMNWMYNQQVSKNGGAWEYDPIKYWPSDAGEKLSFFAYAPATPSITIIDKEDGGITAMSGNTDLGDPWVSYQVGTDVTKHQDVIYASAIDKTNADGTVSFDFRHALSKVTFDIIGWEESSTVYDTATEVTIHSIKLCTERQAATLNLRTGEWSDPVDDSERHAYILSEGNGLLQNNVITSGDTERRQLSVEDMMIFPDLSGDWSDQYVMFLDYTVKTTDAKLLAGEVSHRSNIFRYFTPQFEAGKHYRIAVHLGMNGFEGADDSDDVATVPDEPGKSPEAPAATPASNHTEVCFETEVTPWDGEYDFDLSLVPSTGGGGDPGSWPYFVGTTSDAAPFTYYLYGKTSPAVSGEVEYLKKKYTSTANMFQGQTRLINLDLDQMTTTGVTNMSGMFEGCTNLPTLSITHFDFSKVTNIQNMFKNCSSLNKLTLSGADLRSVTNSSQVTDYCTSLKELNMSDITIGDQPNLTKVWALWKGTPIEKINLDGLTSTTNSLSDGMDGMFRGMSTLKEVSLRNWDVPNLEHMRNMFADCSSLTTVNLEDFGTSNVTNMNYMFEDCLGLTSINIQDVDFSSVTDITGMFSGCKNLTKLSLSGADLSNVGISSLVVNNCDKLTELDMSNIITSDEDNLTKVGNIWRSAPALERLNLNGLASNSTTLFHAGSSIFQAMDKLKDVSLKNWDMPNLEHMDEVFSGCSALTTVDLEDFDTSNVTTMRGIFSGCTLLTDVRIKTVDFSNVTDISRLFYNCKNLNKLSLSGTDLSNVTTSDLVVTNCNNLKELDMSNIVTSDNDNLAKVAAIWRGAPIEKLNMDGLTSSATSTYLDSRGIFQGMYKLREVSLKNWNTPNLASMWRMFSGCSALTTVDLEDFDTSNVTNMSQLFQNCSSLTNAQLKGVDFSNVTDISYLFYGCTSLNKLSLRGADLSKVTNTTQMVYKCNNLKELDLSDATTSTNLRALWTFWKDATALEKLNMDGFTTTNISLSDGVNGMFKDMSSLTEISLKNWFTPNLEHMRYVFAGCTGLTEISFEGWDTSRVINMTSLFDGCTNLTYLDLSTFTPCATVTNMFNNCNAGLRIKCTAAYRDFCIANKSSNKLPAALQSATSANWIIIDE